MPRSVSTRKIFGVALLGLVPAGVAAAALSPLLPGYWGSLVFGLAWYVFAGAILVRLVGKTDVTLPRLMGRRPTGDEARRSAMLVFPLIAVMMGAVWLVFLPLSYLTPQLVVTWLLELPSLLILDEGRLPVAANLVNVIFICVVVPVVEEFVFRGLLFHRWAEKWSPARAVVLSSIAFGVLHIDLLGHTFFGFVMCIVYMRSRSLALPILIHALNNTLVLVFLLAETGFQETDSPYGLAEFQSDWWIGGLCLLVAVPWAFWFARKTWRPADWRPPGWSEDGPILP